jgi:hypothetical protein
MAVTADKASAPALERNWWLRAPAVLVAPRAVFASLRDDSEAAVEARQEPLTAMIGLAGVGAVLGSPVARTFLNDPSDAVVLIPVWAFLGGAFYALAVYWAGGALLFGAARRLGGLGSYRRARSVIALASAPLALALFTLWPIRIAIYGQDLFRTGGNDWGPGDRTFGGLLYAAFGWSALLLLIGVRSVHGWSWARSVATIGLAASLPVLIVLASRFAHGGLN